MLFTVNVAASLLLSRSGSVAVKVIVSDPNQSVLGIVIVATRLASIFTENGAVISLHEGTPDTLIVVSVTDNLLKGASSQAVQNANLMFELPETFAVPDVLFIEELMEHHPELPQYGLQVLQMKPETVADAWSLRNY